MFKILSNKDYKKLCQKIEYLDANNKALSKQLGIEVAQNNDYMFKTASQSNEILDLKANVQYMSKIIEKQNRELEGLYKNLNDEIAKNSKKKDKKVKRNAKH